jgi:ABC-type sulfate/molybdate transport systems ATPase subunit
MTVSDIIGEPLDIHHLYKSRRERADRVAELLDLVGLNSEHANRYAHEFSGGQRQRIALRRALAINPKFIVCDEPVSALDVSIQAQIINTFEDLQKKLNIAYLFIAHDLLVVHHMSKRIAVMYLGKIVETAEADELNQTRSIRIRFRCFPRCLFRTPSLPGRASESCWGRCTEPAEYAERLPLPLALPLCDAALRRRVPGTDGPRRRTSGCLLE